MKIALAQMQQESKSFPKKPRNIIIIYHRMCILKWKGSGTMHPFLSSRMESIRTCTLLGADLIIVPTANTKAEPMEMFEWEMRVQAMQNQVFLAMCNRIGLEGEMDFAGESIVIHPSGEVLAKADDKEQLLVCDIDLKEAAEWKKKVPYLSTRRPECYIDYLNIITGL